MAKAIHMMVRVLEERRSVDFYDQAFGLRSRTASTSTTSRWSICATRRTTSRSS